MVKARSRSPDAVRQMSSKTRRWLELEENRLRLPCPVNPSFTQERLLRKIKKRNFESRLLTYLQKMTGKMARGGADIGIHTTLRTIQAAAEARATAGRAGVGVTRTTLTDHLITVAAAPTANGSVIVLIVTVSVTGTGITIASGPLGPRGQGLIRERIRLHGRRSAKTAASPRRSIPHAGATAVSARQRNRRRTKSAKKSGDWRRRGRESVRNDGGAGTESDLIGIESATVTAAATGNGTETETETGISGPLGDTARRAAKRNRRR